MHSQRRKRFLTAGAVAAVLLAVPAASRADADKCAADAAPAKCYRLEADAIRDSRPAEAAQLYLKSYKLEPKIDPLAGYGFALALDKQYVAAAEVLEKAVEEYEKVRVKLEKDNTEAQTLFQVIHRIDFVKEEINKLVPKIGKVQLKAPNNQLPAGVTVVRKGGNPDMRGANSMLLFVAGEHRRPGVHVSERPQPRGRGRSARGHDLAARRPGRASSSAAPASTIAD